MLPATIELFNYYVCYTMRDSSKNSTRVLKMGFSNFSSEWKLVSDFSPLEMLRCHTKNHIKLK